MVTKWASFISDILFFWSSLFLCFATRPSHCPTVGFFFRGGIVLRWRPFCPTQGKRGAYRSVQHSSIFNWQCFLNLKADQPLLRERISNHAVRSALIPLGIFMNHSHEGHALDLIRVFNKTLKSVLLPSHYGALPSFACCGRLIRIQIEKHGQKGKKKQKAKRLI